MQGGMFLFPLYMDPDDAAAADAPSTVHPLPPAPADGTEVDSQRLIALLRSTTICDLIPAGAPMDDDAVNALPDWAQAVVRSGAFGEVGGDEPMETMLSDEDADGQSETDTRGRLRALQENPESKKMGSDVADSQHEAEENDMAAGTEEVDESPQRTLFTNEEVVADSIDKYSEMIESLVEKLSDYQQLDEPQRDILDVFEHSELRRLLQSLKVMEKASFIQKIEPALLISLMGFLDKQVQHGLTLDILSSSGLEQGANNDWKASGMDIQVITALDAGICELIVMSAHGVDRRVLSEEAIENCVQLLNHVVRRLILPCIDTGFATSVSAPSVLTPKDDEKVAGGHQRGSTSSRINLRSNKSLHKVVDRILPVVCEFMECLAQLLQSVKLADRWILQFSSRMAEFFLLEHSSFAVSLQHSGLLVLRSVFMNYEAHRALVMEEIVGVMMKLPTAKRSLQTVKLYNSTDCIQRVSTVVVAMVQSLVSLQQLDSIEIDLGTDQGAADPSGADAAAIPADLKTIATSTLDVTRDAARLFVRPLLKECFKKTDERDHRAVLENFVDDLLAMVARPEWSGAEVLMEVLSSSLASILSSNLSKDARNLESQHSLSALGLVGKICTTIKLHQNAVARSQLDDDVDAQAVIDDHRRFLAGVGALNRKYADGDASMDKASTPDLIFKHIVIACLRRGNRADMMQVDSRRLLSLRFLTEVLEDTNRDQHEADAEVSLWKSLWGVSRGTGDSHSRVLPPTMDLGIRLNLHLVVLRDFCGLFDKLLAHIMALLSNGVPSFRARVMRALAGIVDVDPLLMAEAGVRAAVQRCFLDERISVRQAAVDLVGKYVMVQPTLFDRYFDMLADRLRDKGVSVRKSVCKIFRSFLTLPLFQNQASIDATPEEDIRRRSACMRSLVERIGDVTEDQVVKSFIIDTFQEVWFGADMPSRRLSSPLNSFDVLGHEELPPGWVAVDSKSSEGTPRDSLKCASAGAEFLSPDGKTARSIEEAWSTYRRPVVTPSSVAKTKRSKVDDSEEVTTIIIEVIHDMPSLDWFVALLQRLLQEVDPTKDTATSGARSSKDRSAEVQIARTRSEKLVSCLVERLLQIEEGGTLTGVTISDAEQQFLSCMKALAAFCEAYPDLLIPHLDHMTLYLKGDESMSKATELKVQTLAISILSDIFRSMERITPRIASRVTEDLSQLIVRSPPSVVGPSVGCLSIIEAGTKKPPCALLKLLELFYGFMVKYSDIKSFADLSSDTSSMLQRALFTAGKIAAAADVDQYPSLARDTKKLSIGNVTEALYAEYSKYLEKSGSVLCGATAVQGLGFLFPLRPRLFLRAQQEGILVSLLMTSPDEMKLQCLTSLNELLEFEEHRVEKGIASKKMDKTKSKQEQIRGDQEADASLIGSVMQAQLANVLALTRSQIARIRTEAVKCVGNLLIQGLVNPLHCIPNLVALETDRVASIRDAAHSHLQELHQKFPNLVNAPSIHGISLSYSFQVSVFGAGGAPTVWALDKDKKVFCLYGRLYSACIRTTRSHRNIFLRALVNQFTVTGSVLSVLDVSEAPAAAVASMPTIGYLCYLAQLLAALPFEVEDEPLYIIYLINRYISLKLSTSLDNLKRDFEARGVFEGIPDDEDPELADIDIRGTLNSSELTDAQLCKLHTDGCVAFALCLLIRLKFALKDMYGLDDERCQTYRPTNAAASAAGETITVPERARRAKLPTIEQFKVVDAVELHWTVFMQTWQAAREDQQQMDFEIGGGKATNILRKKRPQRRKSLPVKRQRTSRRKRKDDTDDDDSGDELLDDDEEF